MRVFGQRGLMAISPVAAVCGTLQQQCVTPSDTGEGNVIFGKYGLPYHNIPHLK